MDMQSQSILDAALALPEAERLVLVERLLETLPDDEIEVTEEEFHAELDRRHAEVMRDPSCLIPWSKLKLEE